MSRQFPNNVHWEAALASPNPIIDRGSFFTCGDALVNWSSFDAHKAQRKLDQAARRHIRQQEAAKGPSVSERLGLGVHRG